MTLPNALGGLTVNRYDVAYMCVFKERCDDSRRWIGIFRYLRGILYIAPVLNVIFDVDGENHRVICRLGMQGGTGQSGEQEESIHS